MKRSLRIIAIFSTLLLIAASAVISVGAKTIYTLYGYSYTIINNTSLSLCGWDNSSSALVVPDSIMERYITEIESRAFQGNTEITSLDLTQASRLNYIGFYSFEGCSNLSNDLVIPKTVTTIREGAFKNCSSLSSVTVNADVTEIERDCFNGCTSLQTAVISDSVTDIGIMAFGNCTNLTRVDIPRSVNNIAASAFKNDSNLTLGVYFDSYAHTYAKNSNIPYVLLDGVLLGDANADEKVDVADVTQIQQFLAELAELDGIYLHAADANQDGTVDISDATALQMYIAEYDIPYPIGEVMTQ